MIHNGNVTAASSVPSEISMAIGGPFDAAPEIDVEGTQAAQHRAERNQQKIRQ
ncbi:MAG TPA: hypothetical protein VGL25_01700 [Casimicrobiaceae bacterium]|jgi:hypothetical protein